MPPPLITSLYAAVLGLMMVALADHVIMLRAKTRVSIGDGGDVHLNERIRRHANFTEYVPMILLLMAMAEVLGSPVLWLHIAGGGLVAGRVLHALGLKHDRPTAFGRVAGTSITLLAAVVLACDILAMSFAG